MEKEVDSTAELIAFMATAIKGSTWRHTQTQLFPDGRLVIHIKIDKEI